MSLNLRMAAVVDTQTIYVAKIEIVASGFAGPDCYGQPGSGSVDAYFRTFDKLDIERLEIAAQHGNSLTIEGGGIRIVGHITKIKQPWIRSYERRVGVSVDSLIWLWPPPRVKSEMKRRSSHNSN